MTLRAVFLHGSNDMYGASRVLVDDVRVLCSMGWRVDVLLPADGPLTSPLEEAGAHVDLANLCVLRKVSLARTRIPVRLPQSVTQADLVILWTLALAPYMPALAIRGKPTVCSVHEIQTGLAGAVLARSAAFLTDALIANSGATGKWLESHRGRRPRPIVAYPVAPKYDPLPLPTSDSPFRILLAGRVNGYKGHIEAVTACRLARAAGLDVRLTLLGSPYPGQEAHLDGLLATIAGEDWISFHGEVNSVRPYLAESHALVVPTTKPESFGLVALEAWAAGRLVLGSDVGGLSEALDFVGGLKFPPRDVHAMARVILYAAQSRVASGRQHTASTSAAGLCSLEQRKAAWSKIFAVLASARRTSARCFEGQEQLEVLS